MRYYIIPKSDIKLIDFKEIVQSKENLRYSLDGSKFIVKTSKDKVSFLLSYKSYSHEEIKKELLSKEWYKEVEQ